MTLFLGTGLTSLSKRNQFKRLQQQESLSMLLPQVPSSNRTCCLHLRSQQPNVSSYLTINLNLVTIRGCQLPNMGAAVSQPLSADVIWKSHVAAGSTNDTMVIPMAVFAYISPQIAIRQKWKRPKPETKRIDWNSVIKVIV